MIMTEWLQIFKAIYFGVKSLIYILIYLLDKITFPKEKFTNKFEIGSTRVRENFDIRTFKMARNAISLVHILIWTALVQRNASKEEHR